MKRFFYGFFIVLIFIGTISIFLAKKIDHPLKSQTYLDKNGLLIGTMNPLNGGYQTWASEFPRNLITATLHKEDRFFHYHPGVNPASIARAIVYNMRGGKTFGGSTITQQLAKNLIQLKTNKFSKRNLPNKIIETFSAFGLEILHSKKWILENYLNTAYYGHKAYGPVSASLVYFGKPLNELTSAQINKLVQFPQNPSRTPSPVYTPSLLPHTRHFLDWLAQNNINTGITGQTITTTLDLNLQNKIASSLQKITATKSQVDPLLNYAAVVIEVATGNIVAMIGSRNYWDESINGQFNTALALRQPGSTLKPFTYYAAFMKGYTKDTLITDNPVSYASELDEDVAQGYMPQNFDKKFHGTLTLGEALGNSLNIPAVKLLNEIGLSTYHDLLQNFGFTTLSKNPAHYGLSVTLGSGEVNLLELTNAYAVLARDGYYQSVRSISTQPEPSEKKAVSIDCENFSKQITAILQDERLRLKSFGFNEDLFFEGLPVAVKTGTSTNQKDNWTLGYTNKYAVGVWMGHADDSEPLTTTGARGTGPLWHAVMELVVDRNQKLPVISYNKPSFQKSTQVKSDSSDAPFKISSPLPHSIFKKTEYLPDEPQKIFAEVKMDENNHNISIYLDGAKTDFLIKNNRASFWIDPEVGVHTLKVASSDYSESVKFKVVE